MRTFGEPREARDALRLSRLAPLRLFEAFQIRGT